MDFDLRYRLAFPADPAIANLEDKHLFSREELSQAGSVAGFRAVTTTPNMVDVNGASAAREYVSELGISPSFTEAFLQTYLRYADLQFRLLPPIRSCIHVRLRVQTLIKLLVSGRIGGLTACHKMVRSRSVHANLSDPLSTGPGIMGGRVRRLSEVDNSTRHRRQEFEQGGQLGGVPFTAPSLSGGPARPLRPPLPHCRGGRLGRFVRPRDVAPVEWQLEEAQISLMNTDLHKCSHRSFRLRTMHLTAWRPRSAFTIWSTAA